MIPENASQNPSIHLSPDQIPEVKQPMTVMKLGDVVVASEALLQGIVRAVAPEAKLKKLGNTGARAAYDGRRLVAFVHPKTGESRVFPALETLKPGKQLGERATAISARIARDASLFPKDGTQVTALAPVTLMGSRHIRDGEQTEPEEYLAFVRLDRQVDGLPVFGPGTKAMIAVAADDSVQAFAHRWRRAIPIEEKVAPHSRKQIVKSILTQLAPSAKSADVTIDKVTVGYYDAGENFLQPVYRFQATIAFANRELHAANRRVVGYVSIGEPLEPLPVLGVSQGVLPGEPRGQDERRAAPSSPTLGDPTVGRYVVRNDSGDWVTSANNFLANLQGAGIFFVTPGFTDSQYYWAEPFEFLSDKDNFVNSVNIALNEVHGNWGLFSTRDNHDDLVGLSSIPSSGYGGEGEGSLAYWILHSCEIIPTQTDEATSFDVWWNIFNGLHAVVGYRTEMWINDGVTGPFGFSVGLGASVVSAWLNAVSSNNDYGSNDTNYPDGNRGIEEPMGRASAVVVCGHSDDTAFDLGSLGRANCLTEWWFNN
jgi:Family of unknown function (DUF6345)